MSRLLFPPPPITIAGDTLDHSSHPYTSFSPSSSSSSTSTVILIIVIASAILISASLYLLIRFLSTRLHRSFSAGNPDNFTKSTPQDKLLHSLPLFTLAAVNEKADTRDCAVCLSKFEPNDQLRLLPLCCHAFHAHCIDTWLSSSQTCPLCRSTVTPTEDDVHGKIGDERSNSFRIQIGSVSRRQTQPAEEEAQGLRSYSIGSFEYVVDDGFEVPVEATHHRRREISTCSPADKDSTQVPAGQGEILTPEVNGSQSWLRDYVDRFSSSFSSHSFRSSGHFFTGSSRRSDTVVPEDIESSDVGEEISELFRWISGV